MHPSELSEEKSKVARPDPVLPPAHRRLQILALDPAADIHLETAHISRTTIHIPWEGRPCDCHTGEKSRENDACIYGQPIPELLPGPRGEYLEVVDVDPASTCVYDPVDLNDPLLLARDGHAPSIGNPQFHQQMVYAVAMKTIANFERVLGRTVLWSDRIYGDDGKPLPLDRRYVQRLRIYPHALREENAYYSPVKKALLFGYFNATTSDPRDELPGGVVFTCLSHDIVAHETTHAILDGMHRRLMEASNGDMLAFHEAFADIVAIFQHFTLPGLLLDQIKRNRGDLRMNNRLAQLASQFAQATGRGGALRNALGATDARGRQISPNPLDLNLVYEPHERGAILVAAVFDAFLSMYEHRVADLYRIATGGTGVLPDGDIHPDLAERLADAAASTAQRVLDICIRTLDYLPPVDVNFGDFLRALITADSDFHPEDPHRYRLAFIDAFRNRGIVPRDIRALGEDSLRWNRIDCDYWSDVLKRLLPPTNVLRTMAYANESPEQLDALKDDEEIRKKASESRLEDLWTMAKSLLSVWSVKQPPATSEPRETPNERPSERYMRHHAEHRFAKFLWYWLAGQAHLSKDLNDSARVRVRDCLAREFGLDLQGMIARRNSPDYAPLEVHAVRPTVRRRVDGRTRVELLVMLTQSRLVDLLDEEGKPVLDQDEKPLRFKIRGGCTLLIDPDAGQIHYAICKRLPNSDEVKDNSSARLARQREYIRSQLTADRQLAIDRFRLTEGAWNQRAIAEPFAVVHRSEPDFVSY